MQGQKTFFLSTVSRLALVLYAWILESFSLEVKWLRHQNDHSSPSSAKVRDCSELHFHSLYIFEKLKYFSYLLKHVCHKILSLHCVF